MARKVGLELRAEQLTEHCDVERRVTRVFLHARFQRARRPVDQPGEGAVDGRLAALALHVLSHRSVRALRESRPVEPGQQIAGISIAEIALLPRRRPAPARSETHTPERQSLMCNSDAVFPLKK